MLTKVSVLACAVIMIAGCSRDVPSTETVAPVAAPTTAAPEAGTRVPALDSDPRTAAEQAAALLRFIDTRPECERFRAPLAQAAQAPAGQNIELDMGRLMDDAYQAGCQKRDDG
jgi:hypothetical protein